jgi:hypothetical protein
MIHFPGMQLNFRSPAQSPFDAPADPELLHSVEMFTPTRNESDEIIRVAAKRFAPAALRNVTAWGRAIMRALHPPVPAPL